jgi:hypothetical protein
MCDRALDCEVWQGLQLDAKILGAKHFKALPTAGLVLNLDLVTDPALALHSINQ